MSPGPIRCSRNSERVRRAHDGAPQRAEKSHACGKNIPETFGLNTVTAVSDEADQLAREREHTAAEALYKKLLNQDLGPMLR